MPLTILELLLKIVLVAMEGQTPAQREKMWDHVSARMWSGGGSGSSWTPRQPRRSPWPARSGGALDEPDLVVALRALLAEFRSPENRLLADGCACADRLEAVLTEHAPLETALMERIAPTVSQPQEVPDVKICERCGQPFARHGWLDAVTVLVAGGESIRHDRIYSCPPAASRGGGDT
jgi:hypothetical protein